MLHVRKNGSKDVAVRKMRMHYPDAFSRVLGEIDVGGSADSTGVWIWTLLLTCVEARKRAYRRAIKKENYSPRSQHRHSKTKSPRCWFNGGQYVNQWLAVVTMSRPRRSASGYLLKPSPSPLPNPLLD